MRALIAVAAFLMVVCLVILAFWTYDVWKDHQHTVSVLGETLSSQATGANRVVDQSSRLCRKGPNWECAGFAIGKTARLSTSVYLMAEAVTSSLEREVCPFTLHSSIDYRVHPLTLSRPRNDLLLFVQL